MSFGNNPADRGYEKHRYERFKAKAVNGRAARLAGRKPLIERLLERLRAHREEPGSDPQNFPGIPSDPGD